MEPSSNLRPTLLVFTLGECHESRRRRLLPASRRGLERRLHRACLDTVLDAGRRAGYRLDVSAPTPLQLADDVRFRLQRGDGFGSRLRLALDEALAEGGPVVVVGSDVPDLDLDLLRRTRRLLEEDPGRVVVGPSPDGGFYLLATARPLGELLGEVRWRCRRTLDTLERALRRHGRELVRLPARADLDHRRDLERWLARGGPTPVGRWRSLQRELRATLRALAQSFDAVQEAIFERRVPSPALLRGPPNP